MNTYLQKEENLIKAMKAEQFQLFDGDRDDAYDTLERALVSFPDYANTVIRMQIMMPIWRNRYDGEELRDRISDIDSTRHIRHEAAISGISVLNRLSRIYGLEPFADIDTNDRYAVADFVGSYISEIYEDGTKHSMDSLTKDSTKEYPTKHIAERIAALDTKFDFKSPHEGANTDYEM